MSEENENVEVVVEPAKNPYDGALNTDLREEHAEKKEQYKAARNNCKTVSERKVIMRMYQDDLIDLATEARILQDWDMSTALNQEIDAITRRVSTGRRGW